ncbi:MAG TPA: hypothetical protein PKA98_14280, partial [Acidimicrobiales bacterium]|nr:hypothetical protein [Acidimicrobiales bacterium]
MLVLVGLSVPVSEAQARLAGTVTADEDGRPLEGICVTVYSISSDGFHWLRRGTSSGAAPAPTTSGAGGAATSCAATPTATTCSAARGSTAVAGGRARRPGHAVRAGQRRAVTLT